MPYRIQASLLYRPYGTYTASIINAVLSITTFNWLMKFSLAVSYPDALNIIISPNAIRKVIAIIILYTVPGVYLLLTLSVVFTFTAISLIVNLHIYLL